MSDDLNNNAKKIRDNAIKCFNAITSVDGVRTEAREAAGEASNASYGKREEILRAAAAIAAKGKWSNVDIDAGVAAALTATTNGQKNESLKTFAGEIAKACNERVRDHVDTIFDVSTRLWNAEKAALAEDKDADAPLNAAYSRSIQVAHALMSAALGKKDKKGNWVAVPVIVTNEADVVAFARDRDPAKDVKRIARKLKALRNTFEEFHTEFPHPMFQTIDKALGALTAEALQGARGTVKQPVQTSPGKAIANERKAKANGVAPMEGASDLMADLDLSA
jgi:hypothetical protein